MQVRIGCDVGTNFLCVRVACCVACWSVSECARVCVCVFFFFTVSRTVCLLVLCVTNMFPGTSQDLRSNLSFPTNTLSHKHSIPQTLYPTNTLPHKYFTPQTLYPTDTFPHKHFTPQTLYPTNTLPHKHFTPQTLKPHKHLTPQTLNPHRHLKPTDI
jgi:hypothetical protein